METLQGFIEHIIFRNDENGYTVLNLIADAGEITCVGFFRYADEGENVSLQGEYTEHPVYGKQFQVKEYEIVPPQDKTSMIRYLGSGAIKGIGSSLATRIVSHFGEDTFKIMEEDPERLSEVKGISARKAREIAVQFADKQDMRKIMVFLQQYGISNSLAMKIHERYGTEAYAVICENPYRLAEDINGVGFRIADEIATRVGIRPDSEYRIRSGILYVLQNAVADGHCYLPKDQLLQKTVELLGASEDEIDTQIMNLTMESRLSLRDHDGECRAYIRSFCVMETRCAEMLHDLDVYDDTPADVIRDKVIKYAAKAGIEPDELQITAVVDAVRHGVLIMTGGPGTGKTTTINLMIRYFESEGLDFYLAAPTGRAAKRMTETTGYDAATIQRILKLQPASGDGLRSFTFEKNEEDPLEADVVIIDEMSMVDLPLFHALLKALVPGTRLIMVGDINQLPSVGPGAVLKDLIRSECFRVVELKKIFRQSERSDIVLNAHKINEGKHIRLDNQSKDFFFLPRTDVNHIMKNLITLISEKLPGYVHASPFDIQVLTPMRKGALGVETLNPILQKYLNPPAKDKREKEYGDTLFREGDKVMQIKNDYQLEWEITDSHGFVLDKGTGVFNGDLGVVREIDSYMEWMCVEFEDKKTIRYPFSQLEELELAYAVTIHKSQGSEYPAVLMPLLSGPRMLFNRNLLYTGVTRARRCVTILGSAAVVYDMIDNADEQKRYTGLKDMIIDRYQRKGI
ncbi:MAG: ATP-dependent RecD-like DNA helicase [Lachnospiraceae bacterium]|nr:ATP-dependent RecD-like DNA helicase [Lachnospiraceae bacterium]